MFGRTVPTRRVAVAASLTFASGAVGGLLADHAYLDVVGVTWPGSFFMIADLLTDWALPTLPLVVPVFLLNLPRGKP